MRTEDSAVALSLPPAIDKIRAASWKPIRVLRSVRSNGISPAAHMYSTKHSPCCLLNPATPHVSIWRCACLCLSRSVTACNSPLNGSLLVYSLGERAETAPAVRVGSHGHLLSVAIHMVELLDWELLRRIFDPRYERRASCGRAYFTWSDVLRISQARAVGLRFTNGLLHLNAGETVVESAFWRTTVVPTRFFGFWCANVFFGDVNFSCPRRRLFCPRVPSQVVAL